MRFNSLLKSFLRVHTPNSVYDTSAVEIVTLVVRGHVCAGLDVFCEAARKHVVIMPQLSFIYLFAPLGGARHVKA